MCTFNSKTVSASKSSLERTSLRPPVSMDSRIHLLMTQQLAISPPLMPVVLLMLIHHLGILLIVTSLPAKLASIPVTSIFIFPHTLTAIMVYYLITHLSRVPLLFHHPSITLPILIHPSLLLISCILRVSIVFHSPLA